MSIKLHDILPPPEELISKEEWENIFKHAEEVSKLDEVEARVECIDCDKDLGVMTFSKDDYLKHPRSPHEFRVSMICKECYEKPDEWGDNNT